MNSKYYHCYILNMSPYKKHTKIHHYHKILDYRDIEYQILILKPMNHKIYNLFELDLNIVYNYNGREGIPLHLNNAHLYKCMFLKIK